MADLTLNAVRAVREIRQTLGPRVAEAVAAALAKGSDIVDGASAAASAGAAAAKKFVNNSTKEQVIVVEKKKHRCRKVLGFLGLAGILAGIGFFLWRQTQPLEDPWAEDDWDDIDAPEDAADSN